MDKQNKPSAKVEFQSDWTVSQSIYAATKTVRKKQVTIVSLSSVNQFSNNLGQFAKFYVDMQRSIENPYRPFGLVQTIIIQCNEIVWPYKQDS